MPSWIFPQNSIKMVLLSPFKKSFFKVFFIHIENYQILLITLIITKNCAYNCDCHTNFHIISLFDFCVISFKVKFIKSPINLSIIYIFWWNLAGWISVPRQMYIIFFIDETLRDQQRKCFKNNYLIISPDLLYLRFKLQSRLETEIVKTTLEK